jgi:hypothetical protein
VDIYFFFIYDAEKTSRRKGDMNRRFDDINVDDYHQLECNNCKLMMEIKTNKLEETIERQKDIISEKKHQIDFLENALKKVVSYIKQ